MEAVQNRLDSEALIHLDALYNLARWLTRDAAAAEDLVQETFLKALRASHQFRPGTNLRAWLFQILRNTFLTVKRRERQAPELREPEVLDGLAKTSTGGAGEARWAGSADRTARLDLQSALTQLPEEYRSVVLLADLEDFTMGEIAGIMDCPVGTVKSRLFRARGMLRELLRDYRRA